ncbi:hypothetical protein [Acinetobacter stercoris]|uniref:Uncharacterized protein n=1 Tax=Acinetobacter stercoris TaxID=2126983 RepID=A0A2U3MU12_9GAMM|nr:hypothetical protein [Acinetobacter stercoris]SPL68928.1 hypothetical protein KPC_0106 [Acinetobacter stercoris]
MLFLILIIVIIVLGFVFAQRIDQHRWKRYQIERDLYFRQHPYRLESDQQFAIMVSVSKMQQKKVINALMLKSSSKQVLKKAYVLRDFESNQQGYALKVMIQDIPVTYLDSNYSALFAQSLEQTDFEIGRPIETLAEIMVFGEGEDLRCRIKLDLPKDPVMIKSWLFKKTSR